MTTNETKAIMERYLNGHDAAALADDAEFTIMGTGQHARGRAEVEGLLEFFYHLAFDAKAEIKNVVVEDDRAVVEADFAGRHIGEFGDLKASGKSVRVPLCVSYSVRHGKISSAHVYFETDALRKQIGAA